MAYEPKTSPGGNPYLGGAGTFAQLVAGEAWKAQARDQLDEVVKTEAAARTGFVETDPSTGYSFSVLDAEGRVGELALDTAGRVPQWVLDRWASRLGLVSGAAAFQREALVSAFKARRGQRIGTNGKAVVCLRFDHGWSKFRDVVLPLLRARSLPATQMINPETMGDVHNAGVSYADVQALWLNDGIEVANHAQSHGTATTPAEIHHHIVGALQAIQAGLPRSVVEAYIPGGEAGVGGDAFTGGSPAQFHATTGGPMALAHHAAVFGYMPGPYRVLPQDMTLGGAHISGDTWTAANLQSAVNDTVREGAATTLMWHPANVGTTGNISAADLTAVLDHIVAARDAGRLEVLTMTGSLLADPHTGARHDLIDNGGFRAGLTGWTNAAGWAAATGAVAYATTTTGGMLRQFESGRHLPQIESSNRELLARFRAPAGAVVRVAVTSGAGGLAAARELTLPASPDWVTVRQPFSIPVGATSLTIEAGRVSGGQVDLADVRAHTI